MASQNPFANMTAVQMARTPAAEPPPGVTPNLVDPPSIGNLLIIISTFGMAIMLVAAGLRFYTRLVIRKVFKADDWTALIGIIGTCAYYITCIFAVTVGKYGTHMWDLSIAHFLGDPFIITGFLSNWITTIPWAFAKTTFLLMYLDIFRPLKAQRIAIYIGLFANWAFYTVILIATLYFTSPAPGQSWAESFLSVRYGKMHPWMIPIAAGSLGLDVYILLVPIASVWRLRMSLKKKLGVLSVFATGVVACIASSLSIYYKWILSIHGEDFSYHTLPVLIMCIMEMCVGITASCMPSMALLFRTQGHPLGRLVSATRGILSSKSGDRESRNKAQDVENVPARRAHTHQWSAKIPYLNTESYHTADSVTVNTQIHSNGSRPELGAGEEGGIQQSYELVQEVELQRLHSQAGLLGAGRDRGA
ncbi:hypothetical protein BDW62DRAFT_35076 [Aspergillus aurantiobrunneus]